MEDKIKIFGEVSVYQHERDEHYQDGDTIVDDAKNKFTDIGLKNLRSALCFAGTNEVYHGYTFYGNARSFGPGGLVIYLGTDESTGTTPGDTALQSPIGSAPGTEPDSMDGIVPSQPSPGEYKHGIVATWYSGSVSGTVGEIGLYHDNVRDLPYGWVCDNEPCASNNGMTNRLSTADGEFSSFTIDESKSITVQWDIKSQFG